MAAMNPHCRISRTPGDRFRAPSARGETAIFSFNPGKTDSSSKISRLALAAAQPSAFPV